MFQIYTRPHRRKGTDIYTHNNETIIVHPFISFIGIFFIFARMGAIGLTTIFNETPLDLELSLSTIKFAISWLTYKGLMFGIRGFTILVAEEESSLLCIFIIFAGTSHMLVITRIMKEKL